MEDGNNVDEEIGYYVVLISDEMKNYRHKLETLENVNQVNTECKWFKKKAKLGSIPLSIWTKQY